MTRRLGELRGVTLDADDGGFAVSDGVNPSQTFGPNELELACAAMLHVVAAGAGDDEGLRRRFMGAATALDYFTAINRRDWPALLETVDPTLVVRDHRPVGLGTVSGASNYVETIRQAVELIPNAVWRMKDLLAFDEAGKFALELQVAGTIDGGEVEVASLVIATANDSGLTASFDIYGLDQRDEVLAVFD